MIEIQNLSKTFGAGAERVAALQEVNLSIRQGEIFGIIGLSGAGKSTLVRCMNLLEAPSQGKVFFGGTDLTSLPPKKLREKRREIAMIFQSFHLLEQRNALENVCFPMELAGISKTEARSRAMALLKTVGLPDKAGAYPAQLSGGQKQRVAIARALASEPKVLLCDEATSALDPTTTDSILKLLQAINRERQITVILITHQMSVIEQICHRVAILDQGRVMECGAVQEIFANPKTAAARRLVFPDGAGMDFYSQTPMARIAFNGSAVEIPVISELALELGLKVSILGADTRNVDGKAFGTMIVGLPDAPADREKVLAYLNRQPGLHAEEVR
ncbi:MAG: ATP-binding cassette domain-containing protein [Oscillospiraceae bacterium]|nr:ATP-binding cassette domain-containing protein [Oscillospiraceae bacterium]